CGPGKPPAGNPRGLFILLSQRKYSCSKPNQKSLSSSSIKARPLDGCGVPSELNTSHITNHPFLRWGSGTTKTGLSKQSDDPPGACSVEDPSKLQIDKSDSLPLKSF